MFNADLENTFVNFSLQHGLAVLVVFSLIALIYLNKEKLKEEKRFNRWRYILAFLTIGQEISLNIFRIVNGEWSIQESLPLQLCGLGVILSATVMITKSKKIFVNTFFILMIGAVMAILTPALEDGLGFPHYRYFQYFTSHGLILLNFTFILFVMDYVNDFKYKHILNNFIVLLVIAIFALLIDLITGGNYLYLMEKPGEDTAFDLFGEHPWYIINIFIFGIPIFFHLFYLPFFLRKMRIKKLETSESEI